MGKNCFYARYVKRVIDLFLALVALICLSWFLFILSVIGAIVMRGSPIYKQRRPGKNEKIIEVLKLRTMTNEKDENGRLLPDNKRLTKYGRFLRATSIDELPSLINVIRGEMAIIGPRPLLIEYLPWYTQEERHRHDVRPGITGWAQVNGRNTVDWETRFKLDLEYIDKMSFAMDFKIFILTVHRVLVRSNVARDTRIVEGNFAELRSLKIKD